MDSKFEIFKEGRFWQVWDISKQQLICQLWSKEACEIRKRELDNGINVYREAEAAKLMIVRALPKPPKSIKQVCCNQRYEQINRHYLSLKDNVLLLDASKPLTVEWACTFCGTWHEIHAYQEKDKQTYVSLDAVDIDELPIEV